MNIRRWLGLAEKPLANARGAERPELTEFGATGTPIMGGYLRDLGEYNPTLEGLSAFSTYEKMRRGDGQVAATLMGMKLPIRSAEWAIVEPEDATPIEKEATEFVRSCLIDEIELDAVIENALLMLDFGCAAHEDVYYVDGNRVRLKKLAPRLPSTFNRWIVGEGEELLAIEQYGYAGNVYKTVEVPASKIALFTLNQEGSNFAGRSVLRPMYPHWYIKSNLYRVDAIAQERNGMGVPWIKMAADAKKEDREAALAWLQKLSVHEKAALLLPPGWEFGLAGVTGTVRDAKEPIAHHNVMISMAGLAQFMMLGQSQSGNRALGETMSDFFGQSLEATAKKIARVMNLTTVKRLVDFNFAGIDRYPELAAQNITALRLPELVKVLKELAGEEIIRPDDDLEAEFRRRTGLPKAGQARPLTRPAAPQQDKPTTTERGREAVAASAAPAPMKFRRELKPAEKHLALADIVSTLDQGRDEIAAALRRARSAVQAEIVNKLVNAPVRSMHRVSVAPDERLIAQVESVLAGIAESGFEQVEGERERQLAGKAPAEAEQIRAATVLKKKLKRDPLGVYADGVVGEFITTLTSRAANVALDWMRRPGGLSKGEIIRKVEEELDAQSDKWIDGAAAKGSNEAFADGRAAGYEEYADQIGEVQYSALLDYNTCGNCSHADGAVGRTPDEIPGVPNPDCDGGDKCRCVHVYIFKDEERGR